jgi:hypothetical protein
MGLAMDYVAANGIETEEDYPYTAYDGDCEIDTKKPVYKISSHV